MELSVTHIYTHTHAYKNTYIHTYIHAYIHTLHTCITYINTYIHTHYIHYIHALHTYVHAYVHAYIYTYITYITYMHYIHTYIHTHITYITYMHYIHMYIHTYIHAYITTSSEALCMLTGKTPIIIKLEETAQNYKAKVRTENCEMELDHEVEFKNWPHPADAVIIEEVDSEEDATICA